MKQRPRRQSRAYTLFELVLVVAMLLVLSALVVPAFMEQIEGDALPRSARQLRSLITLVRAHAAFDGKRYRIRFPNEDEWDALGGERQPLIEREDDPLYEPEEFLRVTAPWAVGKTLLGEVWCAEVRLGRPTIERILERRKRVAENIEEELEETLEDVDPERLPLIIGPDSTSEWATFVLTEAPRDIAMDELEDHPRIELIVDGAMGLAWLQRPFYDEELDLFEEKHWPAVLRQDFLDPRVLTEDDVLELREQQMYGSDVQLRGRKIRTEP